AGAGRRVVLALNRVPESVEDKKMASPPRVVIELGGPRPSGPTPVTPFPLSDDLVSQVRVGQAGTHLRAVIDLAPKAPEAYHVRQDGATIIAEIGDTSGASQAAGAAATANAAPAEPESS